jgi:uncharacterized protein YciI
MKYWLSTLVSPRPKFQTDMSAEGAALMREHVRYWMSHFESDKVLISGPVVHPTSDFGGTAVLQLDDIEDPGCFGEADPSIRADVGFRFECMRMPRVIGPTVAAAG